MLRIVLMSLAVLACAAPLAACTSSKCVICYEDEWSREPFPGQPKQHIPPLEPAE